MRSHSVAKSRSCSPTRCWLTRTREKLDGSATLDGVSDSAAIISSVVSGAVSLGAVAGSIISVRLSHRHQARLAVRERLDERRNEVYVEVGQAVSNTWDEIVRVVADREAGQEPSGISNLYSALWPRLTVYASPSVIAAYRRWRSTADRTIEAVTHGRGRFTNTTSAWIALPEAERLRREGTALLSAIRDDLHAIP